PTAIRPPIWDEAVADEHRTMATDDAIAMARRLAREEGILSGPSGGGAVATAVQVAREQDGVVVALLADGGERYLSTPMWE
ncbi:MAG TPA: cysteine synthase, partial [Patescibacteria group bacterium]|nr:cysteine synthase [Patescibacteria group bacterium]